MIGVFDSGFGGLTILRGLVERLPAYSYVYLSDNAQAPYGQKSVDTIVELTWAGVEALFERDCELVILGCNTASASALRRIQQEILPNTYPGKRVLGIVVPTIEQITGVSWQDDAGSQASLSVSGEMVGVLATEVTVRTGVYTKEITKRSPGMSVVEEACPELATLIEDMASRDAVADSVRACVAKLTEKSGPSLSQVVLGCTHYELVADLIAEALTAGVTLFHQPSVVAESLASYLQRHPEMDTRLDKEGKREFLTSAEATAISEQSARYFGEDVQFDQVTL